MKRTVDLPLIRREGQLAPDTFDETANAVEVVWTTGATVRRRSWALFDGREFDEELIVAPKAVRLARLNASAPFLDAHSTWSLSDVIGVVEPGSARIEGGKGLARIRLSRAETDAATVQKIRDGIIANVSVGYRIYAIERIEEDGKMPLVRVVDWEPWEISAVPIGADPGAGMRSGTPSEVFPCAIGGEEGRSSPVLHAIRMRMTQQNVIRLRRR